MDFSCSENSEEESMNEYVTGVFPFGENMTVSPQPVFSSELHSLRGCRQMVFLVPVRYFLWLFPSVFF